MLLDAAPVKTQLMGIPDGAPGTRATLRLMADLVRQYRIDPTIRGQAASLVQRVQAQNYANEVQEVFYYVRDQIRYLMDINGVETIQTPVFTLQHRYGDCDDKSTLLAALLESIGHPSRFIAVGYHAPGEFDHVFVETLIGTRWTPLDAIVPDAEPGWAPMPPHTDDTIFAVMRQSI